MDPQVAESSADSDSGCITIEEQVLTSVPPSNGKLLRIGIFAKVYLLDGAVIRKMPCSRNDEDIRPIVREATIYSILGEHPRIAECLSCGEMDFVDIKYYPYGDLAEFMLKKDNLMLEHQKKWFQQIIEAVVKIHEHDIIHSDLALRQFFIDDKLDVRLGDFNSSQYPGHMALGYEKASHCLPRDYEAPNSVMSDLFALGSTLYELVAHKGPYSELYPVESEEVMRSNDHSVIKARIKRAQRVHLEIETRYRNQNFPDVTFLFGGDIILGCWVGRFSSAKDALRQFMTLPEDS